MKSIVFIFCCFTLSSCTSEGNKPISVVSTGKFYDKDSILAIDSLKWYYYSLNYLGSVLFYDTLNKGIVKIPPVSCEVVLKNAVRINQDSSVHIFSFFKEGLMFKQLQGMTYTFGIVKSKNVVYPLINHGDFEFEKNMDSANALIKRCDSGFRDFLRTYKGEIYPWLKTESMRRNILIP